DRPREAAGAASVGAAPSPSAAAPSSAGGCARGPRAQSSSNSTRHLPSSFCSSLSFARKVRPDRPLNPVTGLAVLPVAISSLTTETGRILPAFFFQSTKPQPALALLQHEYPLRFFITSRPQTGQAPRFTRS